MADSNLDQNMDKRRLADALARLAELERQNQVLGKAQEESQKAQEESRKAQEESQKAQEELRKAQEESRKAQEELTKKHQDTTLAEFLHDCHNLLYLSLRLAPESKCTTGYTKVDSRLYPKFLHRWDGFESLHAQHLAVIRQVCGERRLFAPRSYIRRQATTVPTAAGNEPATVRFEDTAVVQKIHDIFGVLEQDQQTCNDYSFTHFEIVRDLADENAIRADGQGMRTKQDDTQSRAFVLDFKAAHKISINHLRRAITRETLFQDVVARIHAKTAGGEVEQAEAVIARALTQVFDYMLKAGVSYGYLAAGQSLLLLYVDSADPQTLFCHVCIPSKDLDALGEDEFGVWNDALSRTAMAQLASFCLLTLKSDAVDASRLEAHMAQIRSVLNQWPVPYSVIGEEQGPQPSSSLLEPASSRSKREVLPTKMKFRSQSSCKPLTILPPDDQDKDDEPGDDYTQQPAASGTKRKTDSSDRQSEAGKSKRQKGSSVTGSSTRGTRDYSKLFDRKPVKPYCTQACLLGLKRGLDLDEKCPNIGFHRSAEYTSRHPISINQLVDEFTQRLRENPYADCTLVQRKRGAIGRMFKLEFMP